MSIDTEGTSNLLAAAHDYAKQGWRVIALHRVGPDGRTCSCRKGGNCGRNAGKHPINAEWQKAPRLTGPDIEETWGVAKPPNLGIAVGADSGIWVLDIDPEGGGFDTMRDLVAEHGALPTTRVHKTGSGGYHYIWNMPDGLGLRNTQGRIGPGIDTRAEGGQIVAPPSRSGKGDYVVWTDAPVADAPQWLIDACRKEEVDPASIVTAEDLPQPEDIDDEEWARLNSYASKAIAGNLERLDKMRADAKQDLATYRGEPWNATTFQVSAALIEIANSPWCSYSIGQAYADVFEHAPRDPEFDDYVVNKTFESAREKVGDKARAVPENRRQQPPEEDPLFASPDVRDQSRPTGPDGEPTGPVRGGGGHDTEEFFDKKSLLTDNLAQAVLAEGPIAWGADSIFWSYEKGVWVPDEQVVNRRVVGLLGNEFRKSHAENVAAYLQQIVLKLRAEPLPQWINFRNGMLDWQTGELLGHDPNFKSTVQMQVDWDPAAECPTFDRFLADVMHEDYVALVWEVIGYLMYSGNKFQKAFLLYGSGGNGKGTLLRVIQNLIGVNNLAAESLDDLNGNRFSSINLYGKIANIAGDIDGTYQEHTAAFKKIVGEDMLAGEHKFGKRFHFENWAVPVFSANKIPGSVDVTDGYLRRWVVLHFHKKITNMVPGLSDALSLELPGIAAKAVRALRDLMQRNRFEPHGEARGGEDMMRLAIDQVYRWLQAPHGGPLRSETGSTPVRVLYDAYGYWALRAGQHKLREAEFVERLESLGYTRRTMAGEELIAGLTIENTAGHPASEGMW